MTLKLNKKLFLKNKRVMTLIHELSDFFSTELYSNYILYLDHLYSVSVNVYLTLSSKLLVLTSVNTNFAYIIYESFFKIKNGSLTSVTLQDL